MHKKLAEPPEHLLHAESKSCKHFLTQLHQGIGTEMLHTVSAMVQ